MLDTSGSMNGDKIKNAIESANGFVKRLDSNDKVLTFGSGGEQDNVYPIGQEGRAGDVG